MKVIRSIREIEEDRTKVRVGGKRIAGCEKNREMIVFIECDVDNILRERSLGKFLILIETIMRIF